MTGCCLGCSLLCHGRAGAKVSDDPVLSPARLHLLLSVNPNVMIVQDAFCTRLALLQRVVPFNVRSASTARYYRLVVCDEPRCQIDAQSRARCKSQCQRHAPCTRASRDLDQGWFARVVT